KIVLQVPMIRYFEGMGALIASVIGMTVAIAFMLDYLNAAYGVSLGSLGRELWQLFMGALVMAAVAYGIVFVMSNFIFPMDTKLSVTLTTFLSAGIGGIVVAIIYLKMGFGDDLLGPRMDRIPAILQPKR
ncbi:MAG: polysaccharide biosynthesis C-terminal domain-containing protein, partial [Leuconostoc lactis]